MTIDRQFDYGGDTLSEHSNKLNLIYSVSKVASEISRCCDEFGWKPRGLIITRQDIVFMPNAVKRDMFLEDAICHGGHFSVAKGGQLNAEDLIFVTDYRNISYFESFYGWAREKIIGANYNYSIQFFNDCGLRTTYREELKYGSQMIIDRSYATPP
jgi:hypothetical protein